MKLTQKTWAVCLVSAALLGGLAASAQTVTDPTPPATTDVQTSPSRSFTADLAKASLAKDSTQDLPTVESNIQKMRDDGMGWGQIANALGLNLGAVVSAANRADPATQNAANKPTESGQRGQSANASNRSGTGADNSGGKGGNSGGGNGGGNGGGGRGK
ncbi:MAG: hypothetical protein PSV24_11255 [Rhodoferax sp.]|nr:hypothetical protein [Rhodoferax sp.]